MTRQQQHVTASTSSPHYQHQHSHPPPPHDEADAVSTTTTTSHVKFQTASAAGAATTPASLSSSHSKGHYTHKLRTHTSKLRAQTNRLMSNLKGPPALNCTPVRRYAGHKDGIWEVSVSRMGLPILGTASADHTAMIWGMHSGQALLQYTGHSGSVNSLRFHPTKELVLTASGDGTVHIWQCAVHLHNESSSGRLASSEDELEGGGGGGGGHDKDYGGGGGHGFSSSGMEDDNQFSVLRTPLRSLNGHSGVAIAADWLPGGEQAVTAGKLTTHYARHYLE
jgi:WD40 repeat protein